jgi:hypothetical protein
MTFVIEFCSVFFESIIKLLALFILTSRFKLLTQCRFRVTFAKKFITFSIIKMSPGTELKL